MSGEHLRRLKQLQEENRGSSRCVFGQQNAQRLSFKKVVGTVTILRRLPVRFRELLAQPNIINSTWSIDFMRDTLIYGRKVRILNIIDDFNRDSLTINADYSRSGRTSP
jgi:hypothetical protein